MDLLSETDIYNYIVSEADPVFAQSNDATSNDAFMNWEDLNTPTVDADPFVDRLLETLERQENADAVIDDHCYAAPSTDPSMSPTSSLDRSHSPTISIEDHHGTSESSNDYDILEQATQALYADNTITVQLDADENPPVKRPIVTGRPITVKVKQQTPAARYAQRNANRQRGRPPNSSYTEKIVFDAKSGSNKYPALALTPEERKYMEKEGIRLPTHYPLTKQEESLLKRIRRKIRNKKSAQTSRIKQKEYIDALEYRTDKLEAEKQQLHEKVAQLGEQNKTLMEQIRELQRTVGNGTRRSAQASTCLAVILLSCMLVLSPSMHPLMQSADTNNNNQAAAPKPAIMPGRSLSLQALAPEHLPDAENARSPWHDYMEHLHPKKRKFVADDLSDLFDEQPSPPKSIKMEVEEIVDAEREYPSVYLQNHTQRQRNAYDL